MAAWEEETEVLMDSRADDCSLYRSELACCKAGSCSRALPALESTLEPRPLSEACSCETCWVFGLGSTSMWVASKLVLVRNKPGTGRTSGSDRMLEPVDEDLCPATLLSKSSSKF
jgi:hypothetical protein